MLADRQVRSFRFRPYRPENCLVPILCVTPADESFTHTFFDVCPFSPCGRYLALTRFPYQGKKPVLGDLADVCIIDLDSETVETVHQTGAWSFQLGANVQWGPESEHALYTNDVVEGRAVCVRLDLETRETQRYGGPKYDLAADGSFAIGPDLALINATQDGYGIPDPKGERPRTRTPGDGGNEGIWRTNLPSGESHLLLSLDAFEAAASGEEGTAGAQAYPFHTKINRQGTLVLQVVRFPVAGGRARNPCLFTFAPDGSDLREVIGRAEWSTSGELGGIANHPNWHPDGKRMVLNMVPVTHGLRNIHFCLVSSDGTQLEVLSERHLGSGHPSIDPGGRFLLTDAYPREKWVVDASAEVPLRLIDLATDEEMRLCTVPVDLGAPRRVRRPRQPSWRRLLGPRRATRDAVGGSHFKLDPHPAWDRDSRRICFNGAPEGQRQVFVADVSAI